MPINTKNTKNQHDHRNRPADLKTDIINSAHLKASGFERLITGSYLDPINRVSINGTMSIPVLGEDRVITIHLNNNNVKYVTR